MAEEGGQGGSAPVDPEMIKMLQQLNTQMQQSSEYSKQMVQAINSMSKPMEQMSNLTKAIKESFSDATKAMKEMNSEATKQQSTSTKLKGDYSEIFDSMGDTLLTSKDLNDEGERAKGLMVEMLESQKQIHDKYAEGARTDLEKGERTRAHNKALEEQVGIIGMLKKAAGEYHDSMARGSSGYAKTTASFAEIGLGKSNMQEAVAGIGSKLAGMIPSAGGVGGLIGLMIAGRLEDAKFDAIGQTAALQFNKMGGYAEGFASKMGSISRNLSVASMAGEGDLAAVAEAFSSTGVKASEAMAKVHGFVNVLGAGGGGNNLMVASLAADKALQLPAGTFAKMAGTLSGNFGQAANKSFEQLLNIASAAKDAGVNMTEFMAQTMEASSALRMFHANGAIAAAQMSMGMYKSMGGGGSDAGLNRYAQQYAAAGTSSAVHSIAGLNVGMSAVIGEKMGMGSGLDAWYKMKGGDPNDKGRKELDVTAIAKELGNLAIQNGRTRAEQVYFLQQTTGVDKAGAEVMLQSTKLKDGQAMSNSAQRMMNQGFQSEAEKTSAITRDLKAIRDGLLNVGVGLLGMVVAGIKSIVDGLKWGFGSLMTSRLVNGDAKSRADWEVSAVRYKNDFFDDVKMASKATDRVLGGAGEAGNAVIKLLWDVLDPTHNKNAEQHEEKAKKAVAPSEKAQGHKATHDGGHGGTEHVTVKKPHGKKTTVITIHHQGDDSQTFNGGNDQ